MLQGWGVCARDCSACQSQSVPDAQSWSQGTLSCVGAEKPTLVLCKSNFLFKLLHHLSNPSSISLISYPSYLVNVRLPNAHLCRNQHIWNTSPVLDPGKIKNPNLRREGEQGKNV